MGRRKVLYIEQDTTLRQEVGKTLRSSFDIIETASGERAFSLLEKEPYDLILFANSDFVSFFSSLQKVKGFENLPFVVVCEKNDLPLIQEKGIAHFILRSSIYDEVVFRLQSIFQTHLETAALREALEKFKEQSERDALTSLYNRRGLEKHAHAIIDYSRRHGEDLTFLMVDLDKFKIVNDSFGHHVGDELLKSFADLMTETLRSYDIIGRYGGDEFLVILPNTDEEDGELVAKKLWQATREKIFETTGGEVRITISVGVATISNKIMGETDFQLDKFIIKVDDLLYKAKEEGRDKVSVARVEVLP